MLSSLYSGVTGINAAGFTMSVVGNNIANANTVGFKAGYTSFADILSQSLGGAGGGNQVGRGVSLTDVGTVFSQGSFENTTNGTDLAIEGAGFFVVADNTGTYYTRAGNFIMDDEGYLVNPGGFRLQGYTVDSTGVLGTTLTDISLGQVSSAPKQTDLIQIAANLRGDETAGVTYATTITVYDSIGAAIPLTITFTKLATNAWTYVASVPSAMGTVLAATNTGTIEFDTDGNLASIDGVGSPFLDKTFTVAPAIGGATFDLFWDVWDSDVGAPTGDLTGYADASNTNALFQDGYAPGSIQAISVDQDGGIVGLFDNGQTRTLGQVLLADFTSPWGLTKMGKSIYAESAESGQPTIGLPGTGGRGSVTASSLEMSNVDMASEFVKMITTQRAYQANARVITTSDELLAELMAIKR
jgi:flagellar hook protein FlgE